jgi:hypothetical protein
MKGVNNSAVIILASNYAFFHKLSSIKFSYFPSLLIPSLEINQGMDDRNERLVFECIVQECCDKNKPQFFLVSPKLLQGLRAIENDDITVLLVLNGPGLIIKWNFPELVTATKRAREEDDTSSEIRVSK